MTETSVPAETNARPREPIDAVNTLAAVTLMQHAAGGHETAIGRAHQIAADLRRTDQNASSSWLRSRVPGRTQP